MFPELKPVLTEAFERAPEGSEFVIEEYQASCRTPKGWRNCNLRTQLKRVIRRAGLEPWPRLFHTLRASRETELAQHFPIHVVTAWLGNSPRIALKHYLRVTDADFERAARGAAESGAVALQNPVQQPAAGTRTVSQEMKKAPVVTRAYAKSCDTVQDGANDTSGEDRIRTCGPVTRSPI